MLKCSQCGHENDQTRVFCQNCGSRLERPEGAQATIAGNSPVLGRSTAKKRRFAEGGLVWALVRILRGLLSTAVLAALLAAVIVMGRTPEGIPAAGTANPTQATQLYQSLKAFSETVYPRAIDVTQAQANNYLAARLQAPAGSGGFRPTFQRAFVVMGQGEMKFYVEQEFLGLPVFMALTVVGTGDSAEKVKVTGASVGRLNLPEQLAPFMQKNLQSVIDSVPDASEVLSKTSAISFSPGAAKLSWQGSRTPGG